MLDYKHALMQYKRFCKLCRKRHSAYPWSARPKESWLHCQDPAVQKQPVPSLQGTLQPNWSRMIVTWKYYTRPSKPWCILIFIRWTNFHSCILQGVTSQVLWTCPEANFDSQASNQNLEHNVLLLYSHVLLGNSQFVISKRSSCWIGAEGLSSISPNLLHTILLVFFQ